MVNRKIREARLRGGFTLITPRAATHCTVPPHILSLSLLSCTAMSPCGILARDTSDCKVNRVKEKALVLSGALLQHTGTVKLQSSRRFVSSSIICAEGDNHATASSVVPLAWTGENGRQMVPDTASLRCTQHQQQ